ncbi:MAG: hypothetical protein WCP33_05805, partial [Deltaproteobacteria bacterium]
MSLIIPKFKGLCFGSFLKKLLIGTLWECWCPGHDPDQVTGGIADGRRAVIRRQIDHEVRCLEGPDELDPPSGIGLLIQHGSNRMHLLALCREILLVKG